MSGHSLDMYWPLIARALDALAAIMVTVWLWVSLSRGRFYIGRSFVGKRLEVVQSARPKAFRALSILLAVLIVWAVINAFIWPWPLSFRCLRCL